MLHIATVHWKDDRWIDIQLDYIRRHIKQPFKTYAFLNDIPAAHEAKFDFVSVEPIAEHPIKLNLLAEFARLGSSSEHDLLMFIDGDAFPVGDVMGLAAEKLRRYPLMAVQRLENGGDIQPHPSFCITTIGFWKDLRADWKPGYEWRNAQGRSVTDVGGNLLGQLRARNIEWFPMLRSNRTELHPLFFGVYADVVYHHGAGFRVALCRADIEEESSRLDRLLRQMPKVRGVRRLQRWSERNVHSRASRKYTQLSQDVYDRIRSDDEFYTYFLNP